MLTINFDLTQFESVELVTIADVHIGNPLCQEGGKDGHEKGKSTKTGATFMWKYCYRRKI